MKRRMLFGLLGLLWLLPAAALADSVTPSTYETVMGLGEEVTITKTVTITDEITTAKIDVLFLFDTTGSMGGVLDSAKTNANAILSSVSGLGDVAFGVAHYEDFYNESYDWGGVADVPFALVTSMTTDATAAQAGISSLSLGWGNDTPEANLYALSESATGAGWRTDTTKMIVWFGDAPGHVDTDDGGAYPGPSLAATISTLTGEDVIVLGMNVGYPDFGIDDLYDGMNQATEIADATGGGVFDYSDTSGAVEIITDAISSIYDEYSSVSLEAVGNMPGVGVAISPGSYTGAFDRTETREFEFDVTFTGLALGVHDFEILAKTDGLIVAVETDRITVRGGDVDPVPEPATMLLLGTGLAGLAGVSRRKRSKS